MAGPKSWEGILEMWGVGLGIDRKVHKDASQRLTRIWLGRNQNRLDNGLALNMVHTSVHTCARQGRDAQEAVLFQIKNRCESQGRGCDSVE